VRLAVIPARGGSVRVPLKNIRDFRGRPMLEYPIEAAKDSGLFDLIVVSTDDSAIAEVAFRNGCVVVPRPLDDGSTGTQEIAAQVLDQLQASGSYCCVIYPCSPLLTGFYLRQGYAALLKPEARCFTRSVGPDGEDAGCFYFGWTRAFRDRRPLDEFNTTDYVLPPGRVIDVNTEADWSRALSMYDALRRAS
jgi:pseudaminic acid cytidylyltransferase